jgi:DNA-nicking Smr family endonuclease
VRVIHGKAHIAGKEPVLKGVRVVSHWDDVLAYRSAAVAGGGGAVLVLLRGT